MNLQGVLDRLSHESALRRIPLVLVGGWALHHHGVSRQTLDVDFMVAAEYLKDVGRILESCGYEMVYRTNLFSKYRSCEESLLDVDVMQIDGGTMRKILEKAKSARMGDADFRVPCLDHLLAMKMHALKHNEQYRLSKDFPDILALVEQNNVDVESDAFRELCFRFGNESLLKRIREAKPRAPQ